MKKLLVLVLVASLTALANGMILQISVNGDPEPVDSQVTLEPGATATLDIWTPTGWQTGGPDDLYWAIVVMGGVGGVITADSGTAQIPPAPDMSGILPGVDNDPFFPGDGGTYGGIAGSPAQGQSAPSGVYFDNIVFTCVGTADAVIQIWSTTDYGNYTLEDQVIIHQPEPATIALLSLGGLLLRKKR